jgi:hypothetical protein
VAKTIKVGDMVVVGKKPTTPFYGDQWCSEMNAFVGCQFVVQRVKVWNPVTHTMLDAEESIVGPFVWVQGPGPSLDFNWPSECFFPPEPQPEVVVSNHYNARCPKCNGRAYLGLALINCEREGGCLATREPTRDEVASYKDPHTGDVLWAWCNVGAAKSGITTQGIGLPTRQMAVDAWRASVLEHARKEK